MAMGETARGLFDTTREIATWDEFMQALKPKFFSSHGGIPVARGDPKPADERRLTPIPRHHPDLQALNQRVLPWHAPH